MCIKPAHRLGQVSLGPELNLTRLDRVTRFRTHIRSNVWVRSDVLSNWLGGSELSISRIWALDWAKILDYVKIFVISFFWAFLAQITRFDSLINHVDFRFFEFPIYFKLDLFFT